MHVSSSFKPSVSLATANTVRAKHSVTDNAEVDMRFGIGANPLPFISDGGVSLLHQLGNWWGHVSGGATALGTSFSVGSDVTGYTIKAKLLAGHLASWMTHFQGPITAVTGGIVGASVLAKQYGNQALQLLRPLPPTPLD
jgi:hypothetical protein